MEQSLQRMRRLVQDASHRLQQNGCFVRSSGPNSLPYQNRFVCTHQCPQTPLKRRKLDTDCVTQTKKTTRIWQSLGVRINATISCQAESLSIELPLSPYSGTHDGQQSTRGRIIFGTPAVPSSRNSDSYCSIARGLDGTTEKYSQTYQEAWDQRNIKELRLSFIPNIRRPEKRTRPRTTAAATSKFAFPPTQNHISERFDLEEKFANTYYARNYFQQSAELIGERTNNTNTALYQRQKRPCAVEDTNQVDSHHHSVQLSHPVTNVSEPPTLMTSDSPKAVSETSASTSPARHRPLVVGLTKPPSQTNMATSEAAAALNREIEKNVSNNTKSAAPAEEGTAESSSQPKQKKEKAPKQPKPPKAAPAVAPTSPALIDLRVGHILRAIAHPNADSLYVSTIAMGDPEGTEHTQVDEETGKVVRTVCSGLNGLVPLAEMQDRKIIVVANLKPVNMRSIKSAAMVLAASPKQEEGADPHAPDRVVELVMPPAGSEAGDKVYFEGWPYGDGLGPEKQLNPKKKQWEAIQPGFYTSDDLVVGFDASKCEEVSGSDKGKLVVQGKGACTVKTLKGAVVR